MPTLVKVCGITSPRDGLLAAKAGASAIGLVFWPKSPRFVERAMARQIVEVLPSFVLRVGVFVDQSLDMMTRTTDDVGLDVIQLHGNEPPEMVACLPRRVLKAVRVGGDSVLEDVKRYEGASILLDTQDDLRPGGTGKSFDWQLAQSVRAHTRFLVLAGGLNADNVASAIRTVGPDAVDVSSGVESEPGRKDPAKLKAFFAAVRGAGAAR
jgi:phosphoribosylanthranilate isomerase